MYYKELDYSQLGIEPYSDRYSTGLEDIRMYIVNGITRFIATSVGYSPYGYGADAPSRRRPVTRTWYRKTTRWH